jgi:hypothetical protein
MGINIPEREKFEIAGYLYRNPHYIMIWYVPGSQPFW